MQVHTHTTTHVGTCVEARNKHWPSSVSQSQPYFLRQGLYLNLELAKLAWLSSQKPPGNLTASEPHLYDAEHSPTPGFFPGSLCLNTERCTEYTISLAATPEFLKYMVGGKRSCKKNRGQQDGKGMTTKPETFHPWDTEGGRREPTLTSWPPACKQALWHTGRRKQIHRNKYMQYKLKNNQSGNKMLNFLSLKKSLGA